MASRTVDLLDWARLPGPARVLAVARQRWEAGKRGPTVVVGAYASESERHQLGLLVGTHWADSEARLTLGRLQRGLASIGSDLVELLEQLGGPLRDLPAEHLAAQALQIAESDRACAVLQAGGLTAELARQAVAGHWLGRQETAFWRAERAVSVLGRLPAPEGTLLAELAAETLGDPHALDRRFALGGLVLRLFGLRESGVDPGPIKDALSRRWAWSQAGVTYDRVSSMVLVLNLPLPLPSSGAGAAASRLCASVTGEPLWLTLRMISDDLRLPEDCLEGCVIRVCENPSIVEAAADRLGQRSAPLVCTFGQVSVTSVSLLNALSRAGAQLLISGDRDGPGLMISAGLFDRLAGAQPWLPELPGVFEEERMSALIDDLSTPTHRTPTWLA